MAMKDKYTVTYGLVSQAPEARGKIIEQQQLTLTQKIVLSIYILMKPVFAMSAFLLSIMILFD